MFAPLASHACDVPPDKTDNQTPHVESSAFVRFSYEDHDAVQRRRVSLRTSVGEGPKALRYLSPGVRSPLFVNVSNVGDHGVG